jgi:hypothetical protein
MVALFSPSSNFRLGHVTEHKAGNSAPLRNRDTWSRPGRRWLRLATGMHNQGKYIKSQYSSREVEVDQLAINRFSLSRKAVYQNTARASLEAHLLLTKGTEGLTKYPTKPPANSFVSRDYSGPQDRSCGLSVWAYF